MPFQNSPFPPMHPTRREAANAQPIIYSHSTQSLPVYLHVITQWMAGHDNSASLAAQRTQNKNKLPTPTASLRPVHYNTTRPGTSNGTTSGNVHLLYPPVVGKWNGTHRWQRVGLSTLHTPMSNRNQPLTTRTTTQSNVARYINESSVFSFAPSF